MSLLLNLEWNALARAAAGMAVGELWQGILLATGLALSLRFAPRTRAAHRFALWLSSFLLLVFLPLLPRLSAARSAAVSSVQVVGGSASVAWFRLDERWGFWILALWSVLTLSRLFWLASSALRARKIWKEAEPLGCPVEGAGEKLFLRAPVEIRSTRQLERPAVIGSFRPRILIPEWLVGKLTAGELRQIVLHELEHLRRGDDWTLLLQKFCVALFPLNPALLWMDRRLGREREMACDEGVVRRTRAPRAYAACLANLAERRMERKLACRAEALALGIVRRRPELAERVASLLWAKQTLGPVGRTALASAFGCGLLVSTVALTHAPRLVAFVADEPAPARVLASALPVAPREALAMPVPVKRKVLPQSAKSLSAEVLPTAPQVAAMDPALEPATAALPVRAQMNSGAEQTGGSGWVILAVFEQKVETRHQGRSVVTADYEIDAAPVRQIDPSSEPVKGSAAAEKNFGQKLLVVPIRESWVFFEL